VESWLHLLSFFLNVHVIVRLRLYFSVSGFLVLQEDPVLLAPETKEQKPGIAAIKELHGIALWCSIGFFIDHFCVLCPIWRTHTHAIGIYIRCLYILPFSLYSSHLLLMLNILSGEAKT
jgi:hypothetical protein